MSLRTSLLLAAAALSGCAGLTQPAKAPISYRCDNGSILTVAYSNDTALLRREDGKAFVLPQQIASSGFIYSTGRLDLRGDDEQIVWTADASRPLTCTRMAAQDVPAKAEDEERLPPRKY